MFWVVVSRIGSIPKPWVLSRKAREIYSSSPWQPRSPPTKCSWRHNHVITWRQQSEVEAGISKWTIDHVVPLNVLFAPNHVVTDNDKCNIGKPFKVKGHCVMDESMIWHCVPQMIQFEKISSAKVQTHARRPWNTKHAHIGISSMKECSHWKGNQELKTLKYGECMNPALRDNVNLKNVLENTASTPPAEMANKTYMK